MILLVSMWDYSMKETIDVFILTGCEEVRYCNSVSGVRKLDIALQWTEVF